MKLVNFAKILPISIGLSGCMMMEDNSFLTKNLTVYSDNQWDGVRFYDNCNMRKKVDLSDRLMKGSDDGISYLRFQLKDGQMGACGSDKKPRNGAPFWERVELKQASALNSDSHYKLSFQARFVEGFAGNRETFFQLHGWQKSCPGGPPMRFMFNEGKLSMQPFVDGGYSAPAHTAYEITEFLGKWRQFRIEFSTFGESVMKLYIDDALAVETPFEISDCAVPHLKIGIYRAGATSPDSNATSAVDFAKIRLEEISQ